MKGVKNDETRDTWIKGNPQADHFWTKNYFRKIDEIDEETRTLIVTGRLL